MEGRVFYDGKVANTLKKLAKPLGADFGMATVLSRTQHFWVYDSGAVPTDGCRYALLRNLDACRR
jgi:hypothetical protein